VRRLDLSEPEKIELALAYVLEKRQGREVDIALFRCSLG
jgi:hypothetical protein